MGIYENWMLQHDVEIANDLYLYSGTLTKNGFDLIVNGTFYSLGGVIIE